MNKDSLDLIGLAIMFLIIFLGITMIANVGFHRKMEIALIEGLGIAAITIGSYMAIDYYIYKKSEGKNGSN